MPKPDTSPHPRRPRVAEPLGAGGLCVVWSYGDFQKDLVNKGSS